MKAKRMGLLEGALPVTGGLRGEAGPLAIEVAFVAGDIVRIRVTPTQAEGALDRPAQPYTTQEGAGAYSEVTLDEGMDHPQAGGHPGWRLSTNEAQVLLINDPDTGLRINFCDGAGQILCRDEPGLGHQRQGDRLSVYKHLQPGERFIGLGEKTGPLDRRGRAYLHWNTDAFDYGDGDDPLYLSTPFYMGLHAGRTYGLFVNNTYKSVVNLGASNNRFSSITVEGGVLEYFLFAGPGPAEILSRYTWLTGRMPLPPRWALGLQQCRYSYYPQAEVRTVARTYREKDIPADTIYLDIHYMDAYKVFTWHPKNFSEPQKMLSELAAEGFRTVVIYDPGIKVEPGYEAYDSGLAGGHFVTYPDGVPYQGQVWPGWCHFPDFTSPYARAWWQDHMAQQVGEGLAGFWVDMNEPAAWGQTVPDNIEFSLEGRGGSHMEAHNLYGYQMARATYEGALRHAPDKRPFVLTRAGFSGVQRFAAVWTGDNHSDDGHMLLGVRLLNAMGLTGVAFCGMDIGGFVGDCGPELFARWMSIGAFSPLCRIHTMVNSRDSEPWSYGEATEAISRNYAKLRYRLLPYFYTLFKEASETGMPIQRSMALTHPHHYPTYDTTYHHQFWTGPSLLVAPASTYQQFVSIWLPEMAGGDWHELYEGGRRPGGHHIVPCPLDRLPVFVPPGAILPMQSAVAHTGETGDGILYLHLYQGSAPSEGRLYWDAGEGFEFLPDRGGVHHDRALRWYPDGPEAGTRTGTLTLEAPKGSFVPPWHTLRVILHGFDDRMTLAVYPGHEGPIEGSVSHGGDTDLDKAMTPHEMIPLVGANYRFIEPLPAFDPFGNDVSVHETFVRLADLAYPADGALSLRIL